MSALTNLVRTAQDKCPGLIVFFSSVKAQRFVVELSYRNQQFHTISVERGQASESQLILELSRDIYEWYEKVKDE